MLLKMFWSWPRRKIMATMTAMAITAMMSAYSTRPWPSSSRKKASIPWTSFPSVLDGRLSGRRMVSLVRPGPPTSPRKYGLGPLDTLRRPRFRLAKVGVALRGDLAPEGFERAGGPLRDRQVASQGRRDGVAELLDRATEELPAGLEFGPQTEETEGVVAAHVETAAELVE